MEGNGYYGESEQGYGDGWGTNSRRNVGMYSSESAYMQRGLYYGGTTGLTGYGGMGQSQRIASSVNAMMGYGYGDMEAPSSHQDTTDHSSMHSYDYSASTLGSQNSYPQRSDATATQKRVVSSFEENMALMQGGSYAGSSPYGRGASKKSSAPSDYTDSKTGGSLGSLGQKGSGTYKSVAPPDVGTFSYGYDSYSSQKRQTNVSDFEPRMFDETRYRIGSGMPSRGRGRGRGGRGYGEDNFQKGAKRNDAGFHQGRPYPKKKKASVTGAKNPVSFLNEIRPNIEFEIGDMQGPSNMPTFTVSLQFDGQTYSASSRSKKLAKRIATEAALKVYLRSDAARQLGYTEDMIEFSNEEGTASQDDNHVTPVRKPAKPLEDSTAKTEDNGLGGKNPVMYLNELKKDAVYDLKEETGMAHNKSFVMRVTVGAQSFEGSGQNKKLAKAAAALEALKALGLLKQE